MNLENALAEVTQTLAGHNEWLLVHKSGQSFPLQTAEIELSIERERIILGFLDEKGFQVWRVTDYRIEPKNLTLDVTRNFGRDNERIRFVPRASAAELSQAVKLARLEKANRIAALIAAENPQTKLVRVAVNEPNGRFAEISFEDARRKRIAALADVSDVATPENILATAILWLTKLQTRGKNPINEVWILVEKKPYKNLRKLHALLRENWKSKIFVKQISRQNANAQSEQIISKRNLSIPDLWREKPPKLQSASEKETSRAAEEIVRLAPDKIDFISTRHGETLRFLGLPMARVRVIGETEKIWFGTEPAKRILNEQAREDFFELLETLEIYRRPDSANKRHEFFRLAPEAWLEAILRRNIKLLDGNLILSPIHNQFRHAGDKIDLLALRRDGRLVVIELKVAPDRDMIFQAADYWRKIELQRRSGNLRKAKIFGDLEIADKPTVVYLVAPTLSFHYNFDFLSKIVSLEIEIYRFDLNENWRENLKVMKVERVRAEN
jgi:hypothetical protein